MRGIDEECPYLRRVLLRIQCAGVTTCARVTTEQRAPITPTAASNALTVGLDHEIGAVVNQLGIDTKCAP